MPMQRLTLTIDPDVLDRLKQAATAANQALSPYVVALIGAGSDSQQLLPARAQRDADKATAAAALSKKLEAAVCRCSTQAQTIVRLETELEQQRAGGAWRAATCTALQAKLEALQDKQVRDIDAGREALHAAKRIAAQQLAAVRSERATRAALRGAAAGGIITILLGLAAVAVLPYDARLPQFVARLAMGGGDRLAAAARLAGYGHYGGRFMLAANSCPVPQSAVARPAARRSPPHRRQR